MSITRSLLIVLFLVSGIDDAIGQKTFQVAFWNVENLFDTIDDTATRDDDFTPSGRYNWTNERLSKKYLDLSFVIQGLNTNKDLKLLGLSEIENADVLTTLNEDYLKQGLEIIHQESRDERGIDCALLFDPAYFTLKQKHFHTVYLAGDEKTRDIIEAEFIIKGSKTARSIYVFVNHWPSHWGGQLETEPLRRRAAQTLRKRVDHILRENPQADIIIMGDFNDQPDEPALQEVLRAFELKPGSYPGDLINTTWDIHSDQNRGTYMWKDKWGTIDQIIISSGMLDRLGFSWLLNSTQAFKPDYLIEQNGNYEGWPFRMYRNGMYFGGFSDHLPITCQLSYIES